MYEAFDREQERMVWLVALPGLPERDVARVQTEFDAWRRVQHRNLIGLGQLACSAGTWFYTMSMHQLIEWVDYVHHHSERSSLSSPAIHARDAVGANDVTPASELRAVVTRLRPVTAVVTDASDLSSVTANDDAASPGLLASPPRHASVTADERRLRDTFAQLVSALRALHHGGTVHRRLTPSRLQVTTGGGLLVIPCFAHRRLDLDVGEDSWLHYAAPECLRTESRRPAADWYSVGVLLFEVLTGQRLCPGTLKDIVLAKQHEPPDPRALAPDSPPDLADLCAAMIAVQPERRSSADAIVLAIRDADQGDSNDASTNVFNRAQSLQRDEVEPVISPDVLPTPAPAPSMPGHLGPPSARHSQTEISSVSAAMADGDGARVQATAISRAPVPHGDPLPPDERLRAGHRVGAYIVDDLVSEGGFALVYRAYHEASGEPAALKILRQSLAVSKRMLERFWQEAHIIRRFRHPNIVEMYQIGEFAVGRPYIAMEWLDGQNLRQMIADHGGFDTHTALEIMRQIGDALACVHQAGIIHRDIKSDNIVVLSERDTLTIKLCDFGISKLTAPEDQHRALTTRTFIGTPVTMAPEQILNQPVDARTDLYALGVVLYELVCGRVPFRAQNVVEIEQMHLYKPPPRASDRAPVSKRFDEVVFRAMAKHQQDRYPDVRQLLADLQAALEGDQPLEHVVPGLGIAVELVSKAAGDAGAEPEDAPDDALDDAIDDALDQFDDLFEANRVDVVLRASDAVFGVIACPPGGDWSKQRAALLEALANGYRAWVADHPEVSVALRVTVHTAEVVVKQESGRYRPVRGPLLKRQTWPTRPPDAGLVATRPALVGVLPLDAADASANPRSFQWRLLVSDPEFYAIE